MENKFKEGETVYANIAPTIKLTVRRFVDEVYYCRVAEDPSHKELVYFERELVGGS